MSELPGSSTILFVDDEPDVLDSLRRVFLEEDLKVLVAQSAKEGLEIIDRESVEMVVADYKMPGMNGAEMLSEIHERGGDTVGILLSAYAETELVAELGETGVIYCFIAKPWHDDELRLTIRRGLEHRRAQQERARIQDELTRLRRVVEEVPFGLVGIELDGNVGVAVRPDSLSRIYTRKPGVGHHFRAFLVPELVDVVERALAKGTGAMIQSEAGEQVACCLPARDGGCILLTDEGMGLELKGEEVVVLKEPGS